MNTLKHILILFAVVSYSVGAAQISQDDMIEKIYIQTDKPMYVPGDYIWYNLTVYNAHNLPALLSDDVRIQVKKPDGSTFYDKNYTLINGQVSDALLLDKNTPGGIYRFVASTGWMTDSTPKVVYEKEIYIQKFISPRVLMEIDLNRESYGRGDAIVATFVARDLKDNPLQDVDVQYSLYADGVELERFYTQTNNKGVAALKGTIPLDVKEQAISISAKITYKSQIESIRKSIPVILDDVDIQFLAEGGFLLAGVENKMAFKAIAANGKPADVEGDILDSNGNRVTGFRSMHDGMGVFSITPKVGDTYFARLCKPYKSERLIPIENIRNGGSKVEVDALGQEKLKIKLLGEIDKSMRLEVSDVAGVKWQSDRIRAAIDIPIDHLPRGIYKISLIHAGQTVSERLIFLHPERTLNVNIVLDKDIYGLRNNVNAKIKTTDSEGLPVSSQVCIAAVEDKMLSHADDKQAHLVTELLLSSELHGDIHEPNYYFDSINMERTAALDLVMLTNGWRTHYDALDSGAAQQYYQSLNTYVGQLVGYRADNKVGETKIYVIDYTDKSAYSLMTDEDGYFSVIREEGKNLTLCANVRNNQFYFKEVNLAAMKKREPLSFEKLAEKIEKKGMIGKVVEEDTQKEIAEVNVSLKEGVSMDAVQIVAYKLPLTEMDHTTSGSTVTAESIRSLPTKSIHAIAATTAGVSVGRGDVSIRGSRSNATVYYMDGVRISGVLPQIAFADEIENDFEEEVSMHLPFYRNNNRNHRTRLISRRIAQKRKVLPKAIKFYVPRYDQSEVQKRTDFRQTIYWNPRVQTDERGEAEISFSTSDEVTSFSVIVEGVSTSGEVGRGVGKIVVAKPLSSDCKIPSYFVQGDTSVLRVIVENDSDKAKRISIKVGNTGSLVLDILGDHIKTIEARSSHVFFTQAIATGSESGHLDIKISNGEETDYISQNYDVLSPYFPLFYSASGVDSDTFYHTLSAPVPSSIRVDYKTYNPVSSALEGIESMLRTPGGCFEQVSSSTYPNVMVLQYLQKHNNQDAELQEKALRYIKDGYNRLVDYETKVDGFDWWGKAPGHVALTAYGLLEFSDMMEVYDKVDKQMIMRTINYLLKNRDGKGGFTLGKGYDGFGSAVYEVQTAYVLYALSEQSIKKVNVEKEYTKAKENAMRSKDLYLIGLLAMTAHNNGLIDDYRLFMDIIKDELRVKDLNTIESKNTITRSGSNDNNTETISVCALAYMKSENVDIGGVSRLIDHISTKRRRGRFGSTQATCLAIQSILKYAEWQGAKQNAGKILARLNGVMISDSINENSTQLSQFIDENEFRFSTDYTQSSLLNYSLNISYESTLPPTSTDHSLDLGVTLSSPVCNVADRVGMEVVITNKEQNMLANPTVVIGVPSGLSLDHKQLKELKEDEVFDYFELFENRLVLYFNEFSADDVKKITLDLKAEVPGLYTAPPSSAYLYYDEENIIWKKGQKIEIRYEREHFE